MAFQTQPNSGVASLKRLKPLVGAWEGAGSLFPNERLHQLLVITKKKRVYQAELYQFRFPKDAVPMPINPPTIDGSKIRISLKNMPARFEGVLDRQSGRMSGRWHWGRQTLPSFQLLPIPMNDANRVRFSLGKPTVKNKSIRYKPPGNQEWGVKTGDLTSANLSWEPLKSYLLAVAKGDYGRIHGVLLAHRQKLVLEQYFYGFGFQDLHEIRSVQKSLVGLVVLKLLETGHFVSLDQSITAYLQASKTHDWPADKKSITLRHLLNMTSGLDAQSYGGESIMQKTPDGDYVAYMLDAPLVRTPGEAFEYHSGAMNILVAISETITGKPFVELLKDHFLTPMKIDRSYFFHDPSGTFYGAGGGAMRPRDLLKIGMLVGNRGWVENTALLKPKTIEDMTSQFLVKPSWPEPEVHYGALWWVRDFTFDSKHIRTHQARGAGGQMICVIPEWDMVWVITGGNYLSLDTFLPSMQDFMKALYLARGAG